MTKDQENALQKHLQENSLKVAAVVQAENLKRESIKKTVRDFNKAVAEREEKIDSALQEKIDARNAELNSQIENLTALIKNQNAK
ncbi:MAG: hypothetical protein IJU55_05390 [Selenomonadaceae bacterium]|nr:hypothetical protein [Selenomonadaceae bacterium]